MAGLPFSDCRSAQAASPALRFSAKTRTGSLRPSTTSLSTTTSLTPSMVGRSNMEGVSEVVVDKDVVEGRKDPVRVFAEKRKAGDAA